MVENKTTVEVFVGEWRRNQGYLEAALTDLSAEQLQLRAGPDQLSVGQLAQHIIAVRVYWFHGLLGEGGEEIAGYAAWDDPDAPARSSAELLQGLNVSWQLIAGAMEGWSTIDLQQTFEYETAEGVVHRSRNWVIWHVLEQNLHHVGEITAALLIYGLPAPDL
jgi:uncharacterized damage-inducible protein DinB